MNGELVADREIRTGPYGLVGFWIGGANELVREIRFWKTARTPQQLKQFMWKTVDGSDENLVLYYPLNGKKRNLETGEITEDETMLWDSATMPNISLFLQGLSLTTMMEKALCSLWLINYRFY